MEGHSDGHMGTKSPQEIEELRRKRLAYFESTQNQSSEQPRLLKEEPQNKHNAELNYTCDRINSKKYQESNSQNKHLRNLEDESSECDTQNDDKFKIVLERLQQKSQTYEEDGYNEEVENLIRLAKKEIAGRYNKNDVSDTFKDCEEINEKGDNSKITMNAKDLQKKYAISVTSNNILPQTVKESSFGSSDFVQNNISSMRLKDKENNQSHIQPSADIRERLKHDLKPQKTEERNIEDLFSGQQLHSRQQQVPRPLKASASESHDYESLATFQKSVDTGVIEDLGLSTHRAESERLENDFASMYDGKELEEKLRHVSPRVFNEVASDDLRFALGEKKYKEFLEKSLKEIDEIHSGRSSDKSFGSKEFGKQKSDACEKDLSKRSGSEKQTVKTVSNSNNVKGSFHRHLQSGENFEKYHDVDSDFTKVTENIDDVSEINPIKGETSHISEDQDNVNSRPLLNRPKNIPKNIYASKRSISENEKEDVSRNYDQLTVSRNVVFSANEIYSQAYGGNTPMTANHFSSVPSSPHLQGQGHHMNPMYQSVNFAYGQQFAQSPSPFAPNSPGIYGFPGQSLAGPFVHPSYHSYSHPLNSADVRPPFLAQGAYPNGGAEMERYIQQMSARSSQSFDASDLQKYPQYYSPMVPRPPDSKPLHPEMKARNVQNTQTKSHLHHIPHMEPHPPESAPSTARIPQQSEFSNYLQQMPKGIPYPPPPENIDLSAYFQYLGSQGYPIPHPGMAPTHPGQTYVTLVPPYTRMDSTEIYPDGRSKESNGQMMIPHPPPQKRDDSSPRRNSRLDVSNSGNVVTISSKQDVPAVGHDGRRGSIQEAPILDQDGKNSSQRHIEGIRQFHEQRRLQQEEDEVLQKQRKFAKASIDRYFNSLEDLYKRDTSQNQLEESIDATEIEENSNSASRTLTESMDNLKMKDGGETLVNTEVTAATSINPGGITEREEKLGIDLSFIKGEQMNVMKNNESSGTGKSNGKLVIVCPECGEVNKPYMSWCADCGDVLIGIDPILMKKGKNGKLKRCVTENQEVQIENIKNMTIVDKDIEGNLGIIPQIVTERDGLESPVHDESYKGKISPNKSDSRDSGRPSSEDMDYGRSEKEITDICENITDPVIKGFIKAYFNRKKQAVNIKEGKDSSASEKDENENNQIVELEEPRQKEVHCNVTESLPVQSKLKPSHSKRTAKKNVPVDIEVFPSNERRSSSRTDPVVPMLNLINSSDEEENRRKNDILLDSSNESNEWNEFFQPPQEMQEVPAEPQQNVDVDSDERQPFLAQVIADNTGPKPKRPTSGNGRGKRGGKTNVNSVVRESIESPGYQRHWVRSSTAWASYNQGELSTKSSLRGQSSRGRPSSGNKGRFMKTRSVDNIPQEGVNGTSSDRRPVNKKQQLNRPASADFNRRTRPSIPQKQNRRSSEPVSEPVAKNDNFQNEDSPTPVQTPSEANTVQTPVQTLSEANTVQTPVQTPSKTNNIPDIPGIVDHRLPVEEIEDMKTNTAGKASAAVPIATVQNTYTKYQEMTPRIRGGELSMWLCFPDEIFLHILSYLPQSALGRCAQVCKTFQRVAMDQTLWKYITVKKKHNLDDDSLIQIGRRHPVSLALIQCHGENVTARGLRELFRECAEYLRELNFSGCSKGALIGDCILLHASARCRNITHVDASWCNVTDSGIGAISESSNRLESLCINGCQMISDEGLETVIKKHGKSLRVLEMFGCFNITQRGIRYLGNHCINLTTLNLGQCYKMTDSCISQLSSSLGKVETIDLRGCKNIKDNCIRYVVKNCPRIKTIVLANCPNISDVSVLEISTYLNDVRNMDVCGCRKITDSGIRAIANNCQNLRYIDISSTGCSHRSVSMLANFCSQRLETVKLNFLSDVTESVLIKLAKHCKRLKLLHLYGCTSVRLPDKIREVNPDLVVEM